MYEIVVGNYHTNSTSLELNIILLCLYTINI
jgi:hypothetical protein